MEYQQIVGNEIKFDMVERFAFYERAKKAFAIVRTYQSLLARTQRLSLSLSCIHLFFVVVGTGESAIYANVILRKGVVLAGKKVAKADDDDAVE
jgi:L-fucose mutarotase/ribose pyranase (RbsD/FucU family)